MSSSKENESCHILIGSTSVYHTPVIECKGVSHGICASSDLECAAACWSVLQVVPDINAPQQNSPKIDLSPPDTRLKFISPQDKCFRRKSTSNPTSRGPWTAAGLCQRAAAQPPRAPCLIRTSHISPVCCNVLHCAAVCCSLRQCTAVYGSVLQRVRVLPGGTR